MADRKAKASKPNAFTAFFKETFGELRKVSWPTAPEVRQLTGIVLLVMAVMGIILGLTDGGARQLLNLIFGVQ